MVQMDIIWLFSVFTYIAFVSHIVAIHHPTLHPYRSTCDICYAIKDYLTWWAIQVAIHSTVDV